MVRFVNNYKNVHRVGWYEFAREKKTKSFFSDLTVAASHEKSINNNSTIGTTTCYVQYKKKFYICTIKLVATFSKQNIINFEFQNDCGVVLEVNLFFKERNCTENKISFSIKAFLLSLSFLPATTSKPPIHSDRKQNLYELQNNWTSTFSFPSHPSKHHHHYYQYRKQKPLFILFSSSPATKSSQWWAATNTIMLILLLLK